MPKAIITLNKLIQDSQDYGSDDEHMISRLFFSIEVDGSKTNDVYVDIKQSVGSDFETSPLEVSKPKNYKGPFNYEAFQIIAENYYRSLVGGHGSGIHVSGDGNIRMRDNTFIKEIITEFQVSNESPAW